MTITESLETQRGRPVEESLWISGGGPPNSCGALTNVYVPRFPPALEAGPGRKSVAFELSSVYRPDRLEVEMWRRARRGQPRGPSRHLEARLDPVISPETGAISSWRAQSHLRSGKGRRYLIVRAQYRDVDGCGDGAMQHASWSFQLRGQPRPGERAETERNGQS
jgi:hypothetical protein